MGWLSRLIGGRAEASDAPQGIDADRAAVVEGLTAFARALYGELAGGDENLFFAPAGITAALAMTWAGARGATADEMARALRFTLPPDRLHPALAALLADVRGAPGCEITTADALFAQAGYRLLPDFLALLRDRYGASLTQLDFAHATEDARRAINGWVEEQTRGRIRDLLAPGVIEPLTRLVLVDAVYFKGNWELQFNPTLTRVEPFHARRGPVDAPLMHQRGSFKLLDERDLQAIELPYAGGALAMVVLLPRANDGLAELERTLDASALTKLLAKLAARAPASVDVVLPKFRIEAGFRLDDALKRLGMPSAFDDARADFSGMNGDPKDLYIGAAVHRAFVDVNEEGTEAAASTAVVMVARSAVITAPTPVFRADHPFVFLIRDARSGAILFLGRLADPTR